MRHARGGPGGRWQALLKYKGGEGEDESKPRALEDVAGRREAKAMAEVWGDSESVRAAAEPEAERGPSKTVGGYMRGHVDSLGDSGSLEHSTIVGYRTSLAYIGKGLGNVPTVSLTSARVQRS